MRLLHFADAHLDTLFRWAPPEFARSRRYGLRATVQRIAQLAVAQQADALTCGGDLYEQELFTPDTAEFLRTTFADLSPLPVYLAPGNHDWYGPTSLYRQVDWTPNVHVFTEDRLNPVPLADGLTLWGAAHRAPANTAGFLDGFRVDRGGVHLALFHGSAQGELAVQGEGKKPHAPFVAGQIPQVGLDHALVGHFHTPADGTWHTYPGNPDPLTFGETGERGAVLLEVADDATVVRTRFMVATSVVADVSVDVTGASHADEILGRVAATLAGRTGVARVTLTGELAPEVDLRLPDVAAACPAGLSALVPRFGELTIGYDTDRLAEEHTVRGQFVRDVGTDPALTADQRRRVLATGLRALDGRADLEVG